MKAPIFITGNAGKAKYLAKYLGVGRRCFARNQ